MSDTSAERLDRLERANRRLTRVVAGLTLLILAGLGLGASRDKPRSIEASRITLRDEGGRVRAEFVADRSGPGFTLFDAEGKERVAVHAADDGTTALSLVTPSKENGPSRSITFSSATNGWSTLSFADAARQERLAVGLGYDGEPRLRMYTKDAKARVTLGSDMSGRVECILHDASGRERAVIRSAPGGSPTIHLYDDEGKSTFRAP